MVARAVPELKTSADKLDGKLFNLRKSDPDSALRHELSEEVVALAAEASKAEP